MTQGEKELVATLEADIQTWEFVAGFFEHSVKDFDTLGGQKMTGAAYAHGLRQRVAEHRQLIEKIKEG
ncbi:MAG TPA: hypothetical protein VJN89_07160 [Candidatus Acidoferrum sp.]|nr:hypothetical protein [Candidatus Acidoferrum sp.]